MKKRIFLGLLQSIIIFFFTADMAKAVYGYHAWLKLSILASCFSSIGIIFVECHAKNKAKEPSNVVNMKGKKTKYRDFSDLMILVAVIIAIVYVFVEGVVLERPFLIGTVISVISFFVGVFCWLAIQSVCYKGE